MASTETGVWDRLERLLDFPVDFPIKVMGRNVEGFAQQVVDLVLAHQPDFDPARVEMRASSGGQWISLTVLVRVSSRTQLEALYKDLAGHPLIKVVL
jgi:putative lipoic acid-binding regulatory protein